MAARREWLQGRVVCAMANAKTGAKRPCVPCSPPLRTLHRSRPPFLSIEYTHHISRNAFGMNERELKALPRAQLQKLAKSNGVKANGKSVDIIKQLLEYYNAKQADRDHDGLNDTAITRSDVSPIKPALRSKESTAQNNGNAAASDIAIEPVVPDEDGAPQAGPSGRSGRRITGATNSEEIADKGKGECH
ncbi:hypothetical protein OH76DRAFT_542746 [Lentinus brumalis]|uniref:SAP domain-containing protein n=1 Tax=Lentinus brumalis TaxID=2498619 RepID=A0A371D9P3_9APHY|nr:hypothetical protein OH76DRAFT_542746 [Polyporus brumalis]